MSKYKYSDDRLSLAQEIAGALKSSGSFVPKDWAGPDLISAVGIALADLQTAQRLIVDLLKEIQHCVDDGTLNQNAVDTNNAIKKARSFIRR